MLGFMCLAQRHKAVTLVRLEPAAPRSRVRQSTTALPIIWINGYLPKLIKSLQCPRWVTKVQAFFIQTVMRIAIDESRHKKVQADQSPALYELCHVISNNVTFDKCSLRHACAASKHCGFPLQRKQH